MKLNLPNKLIIFRFLLAFTVIGLLIAVPYVSNFSYYCNVTKVNVSFLNIIALVLFVFASATDWLDGHLARKNNQVTEFGKIFDPLADKFLVNSVLIIFAAQARIPAWLVVIFIGRDILVDGMRMFLASKNVDVSANIWGKFKTVLQMIALPILFVWFPTGNIYSTINHLFIIPLYIAAVASLFSGFIYLKEGMKVIK